MTMTMADIHMVDCEERGRVWVGGSVVLPGRRFPSEPKIRKDFGFITPKGKRMLTLACGEVEAVMAMSFREGRVSQIDGWMEE